MRVKAMDLGAIAAPAVEHETVEMTFAELAKAYSAVKFDGADLAMRKWIGLLGHHSAWSVSSEQIVAGAEAMIGHGYAASTVNRNISAIGSIYRWAIRERKVAPKKFVSPTIGIPDYPEDIRRVEISPKEITALIDGAQAFSNRKFGVFVRLLSETGARKSELLLRRWKDVDLVAGRIEVLETKTGVPRTLFFKPETAALMRRVWPKRDPDAMLFESKIPGQQIDFRRQWRDLTKAIGRPDLHMHDLRHVAAANLLKGGVTVAVAAQLLGHSSNILQKRYGHLETGHLELAARAAWSQSGAGEARAAA